VAPSSSVRSPLRWDCVLSFLAYTVIRSSFWAFRFRSRQPISPVHAEVSSFALLNCCCPAERYPRSDLMPQFQPTLQATNFKGSFLIYCRSQWPPVWGVNCPARPNIGTVSLNPAQSTGVLCVFILFVLSHMWVEILWRADPPSKESCRKLKIGQNPTKGCRTIIIFSHLLTYLGYCSYYIYIYIYIRA
jgi:hypothetical protein